MSDSEEKTEEPTHKKLEDAAKDGKTWQSKELTGTLALAIAMGLVFFYAAPRIFRAFETSFGQILIQFSNSDRVGLGTSTEIIKDMLIAIAPALIIPVVVSLLIIRLQTGNILSSKPMELKFTNLNPVTNAKNIFSVKTLMMFFIMLFKVMIITVGLYIVIKANLGDLFRAYRSPPEILIIISNNLLINFLFWVFIAFALVSVFDVFFQRHTFMKGMKMSQSEIKREHKQSEGDPHQKHARKASAKEEGPRGNFVFIEKATHVLVGPQGEFLSVYYNPSYNPQPIVINKIRGFLAKEAFAIASSLDKKTIQLQETFDPIWRGATEGSFANEKASALIIECITSNR